MALHLFEEGHIDESITMWRDILRQQPNDLDVRYSLGAALRRKGDTETALTEFRTALRIESNHISSRLGLAETLYIQGYLNDAISEFETVLVTDPNCVRAYDGLGGSYLARAIQKKRKEDWAAAQQVFQKVLALKPDDVDAMNGLGICLYYSGKLEQGIEYVQAAVNLSPTNNAAFNSLYWMQWRLFWKSLYAGKFEQAGITLRKICKQRRLPQPLPRVPEIR